MNIIIIVWYCITVAIQISLLRHNEGAERTFCGGLFERKYLDEVCLLQLKNLDCVQILKCSQIKFLDGIFFVNLSLQCGKLFLFSVWLSIKMAFNLVFNTVFGADHKFTCLIRPYRMLLKLNKTLPVPTIHKE